MIDAADLTDDPPQDDPRERVRQHARAMQAAGRPATEIKRFIDGALAGLASLPASQSAPRFAEGHSRFTPEQLAGRADRAVATAEDEADVENTGVREAQLGGIAAFGRAVPLVDDAQAGAMSLVSGRSPEAEAERLHAAEAANPVSPVNELTGSTIAALAAQQGLSRLGGTRVAQALKNGWRAMRGTAAPTAEVASPLRSLADGPKRLLEPGPSVLPTEAPIASVLQRAASTVAVPTIEATGGAVSRAAKRQAAKSILARMVESEHPFVTPEEFVKGYPISGDPPPASAETLRRLEEGLLRLKRARP